MTDRPVALVTGASRRVGRAIAIDLARSGFDLILTYRTGETDVERTASLASATSAAGASLRRLDLDDLDAVEAFGAAIRSEPRLDAIVLNASAYASTPLETMSAEQVLRQLRVNAVSALLLAAATAPLLARSPLPGGGAIVCLGDMHVMGRPRRGYCAYAMSKAALHEMVRSLAIDLAPRVRVNAVAPGVVAWPDDEDPEVVRAYEARIPLGRPGTPDDAAVTVRWLVTEASYVTGEIIRLDGGRWLA